MRLTTVILIATLMQVSAATFGQRITINERKASFEQVLKSIRSQSGYDVIMDRNILKKAGQVNISVKDATIDEAMKSLLSGLPLKYTIDGKIIVIEEKSSTIIDNIIARFQAIDVRGKVVDSLGNGLPGATVSVKNGKGSTSTDAGGNFQLKNVDEGAVLVVSYLGYVTREVALSKEFMNVVLQQSASKLDEVKVIAYGTTTQRLTTGNSQGIKAADIERQPINNPLYALQGRIAGLQVTPTSGLAGGAVNLQIRGKNSLNYPAEPLIVVDGLPVHNNITGLNNVYLSQISSLSFLNPNDIESIDVLKDADATSIYGSRGANGVILISTKKGKVGKNNIDINIQSGIGNVPKKMKLLNTDQYLTLRKEAYANINFDILSSPPTLTRADVNFWEKDKYTDWQELLIGGNAKYYDFQGSISGGTSSLQYVFGGNYHKETSVFPGENADKKGSAHLRLSSSSANQRFSASLNALYMNNKNTLPGVDFTNLALTLPPNAPDVYQGDGSLNWQLLPSGTRSWDNPYRSLYSNAFLSSINNMIAGSNLSYKPIDFITFKIQLGYNELSGNSFKSNPFLGRPPELQNGTANARFARTSMKNVSVEPQITLNLNLGPGILNALLGGSYQSTIRRDENISADGYLNDALLHDLSAATSYSILNGSSDYKYSAAFARASYNVLDKYLLNVTVRRDGSSRFGPSRQFGNFGSVGAAWIFSQEEFVRNAIPFLSYGKLRASIGTSGNDGIGDYAYLERYSPITETDLYQGTRGYRTSGLFNSYYAWEVTTKKEVGLETGFFDDRILLSGNYFSNRSDNQLLSYPFPAMSGPGSATYNLPAVLENNGIEFLAQLTISNSDKFKWSTSANFTRNRNKLVSYPEFGYSAFSTREIGKPFTGVVQVYDFVGVDVNTGKYQFRNANGDITTSPQDSSRPDGGRNLRVYTDPYFYGGITNSLSFKGFEFDFFLQFCKQNAENPLGYFANIAGTQKNLPIEYLERWSKQGDYTSIQKIFNTLPFDYRESAGTALASTWNYVDASFVRLKTLTLTYSVPWLLTQKANIQSLKVYCTGQNLLTFTPYRGLDPETKSVLNLPQLRMLTIGIRATL